MLKPSLPLLLLVAVTAAAADDARACGPDFPPSLLDDRAAALRDLPDEPFAEAVSHLVDGLVKADVGLVAVEGVDEAAARAHGGDVERALYDRGADEYKRGDLEKARRAWEQLLRLDVAERQQRTTWATFMLARLGHVPWQDVRSAVAKGFVDELGLGAASLGEEARERLQHDDIVGAVTLYGRQARLGSESGALSLLMVVRDVVGDEDDHVSVAARKMVLRGKLLRAPVGQRLLAAYASARPDERVQRMMPIVDALAATPRVEWPDHLAAALYRRGLVDDAARLAARSDSPLSIWVQSKLALRRGDVDGARALLAKASKAFAQSAPPRAPRGDEEWTTWWHPMAQTPQGRVLGEAAVLSLSRNEYVRALDEFIAADSWWQDAAFIAERVLTTAELLRWAEANTSAPHPVVDDADSWGEPKSQKAALRHLLARRLVREGRLDEAIAWFDDPALRDQAIALRDELAAAARAVAVVDANDVAANVVAAGSDADVRRAEALFRAAQITRTHGMELRGTELAPDFFVWSGAFDTSLDWDAEGNEVLRSDLPKGDWVDMAEVHRVDSSRTAPATRFHYRYVAADLAVQAANALPTRTQAYAALLCQGSRWARRDTDRVQAIWRSYVAHGASVDFVGAFGSDYTECPAPDFDKIRQQRIDAEGQAWRERLELLAFPLLPLGISAAILWTTRRRQQRRVGPHISP